MKWIILGTLVIGYPIYFGFSMKLNHPFDFPSDLNSTEIINNYVFSNNRGLALFVLTAVVTLFLLWEHLVKRLTGKLKLSQRFSDMLHPVLKKFLPWFV